MFFEELVDGATHRTRYHTVTAEELHRFAADFDPQPMHLDPAASAALPFGEVIASGFHTIALAWRLWTEIGMGDHGRGGIALEQATWYRPVYAGTTLYAQVEIVGPRVTSGGKGLAMMRFDVRDDQDNQLLTFSTTGLFARMTDESPSLRVER